MQGQCSSCKRRPRVAAPARGGPYTGLLVSAARPALCSAASARPYREPMCISFFALRLVEGLDFVVAFNRDEYILRQAQLQRNCSMQEARGSAGGKGQRAPPAPLASCFFSPPSGQRCCTWQHPSTLHYLLARAAAAAHARSARWLVARTCRRAHARSPCRPAERAHWWEDAPHIIGGRCAWPFNAGQRRVAVRACAQPPRRARTSRAAVHSCACHVLTQGRGACTIAVPAGTWPTGARGSLPACAGALLSSPIC